MGAALYVLAVPISDICYLNIMTNNLRKNEQVNQINYYSLTDKLLFRILGKLSAGGVHGVSKPLKFDIEI